MTQQYGLNVLVFQFIRIFLGELGKVLAEVRESRADLEDVGEVFQHITATVR